jgi:hypothetical protein
MIVNVVNADGTVSQVEAQSDVVSIADADGNVVQATQIIFAQAQAQEPVAE